ncbi:MAG: TfoX/Sxy family protein [Granulosicoccus sp.]
MSEFTDYLTDLLDDFGAVRVRRMFGGYGIYHEGFMFGLIADDVLYLKVDAENMAFFEELDLPTFTYLKNGRTMAMSYRQAPEDFLEDRLVAADWAMRSLAAAQRAKRKKPAS